MERDSINKLNDLIDRIPVTDDNRDEIKEIKQMLSEGDFKNALEKMKGLTYQTQEEKKKGKKKKEKQKVNEYPKKLSSPELEAQFIGLLLENPKLIVRYHFLYEECYFEDSELLNIYKSVIFTEGAAYSSEAVKNGFNFSKSSEEVYQLKLKLKADVEGKNYNVEKIYKELKKLFVLRKSYLEIPVKELQEKIIDITDYELYDQMSVEEVESAINQVTVTGKFKQSVLNMNLTRFLEEGDNNLTNGIDLPFPALTEVFKGLRRGETMAFAMSSN